MSDTPENAGEDAPQTQKATSLPSDTWIIKSMDWEERNAARAAARKAKLPMAKWLGRAVRIAIAAERNAETGLTTLEPEVTTERLEATDPLPPLDEVERLIAIASEWARATGKPPPRQTTHLGYRQINSRLRVGLPDEPGLPRRGIRSPRTPLAITDGDPDPN